MPTMDIVFDIGGLRFRSGLVDESGNLRSQVAFESPTRPEEILEHIIRVVDNFSLEAPDALVSIAIGGMVEKNGLVTAGSLNMVDFPLVERLNLNRPAIVLNDAKASALAELTYNPRLANRSSFVVITHSMGIGSGIIINGELYEGDTGTAGEIGHLLIDRGLDAYCRLGHRGCLDSLVSGRALNNRLRSLWRQGHWTNYEREVTIRDLPELLADGDGMAVRVIREVGHWIGMGIMQTVRVLDPSEIIFKGYVATELWSYLQPNIAYVLGTFDRQTSLSLSSLGENVGLIGAGVAARKYRDKLAAV